MKYNWPAVVDAFRLIVIENIKFVDKNARDFQDSFKNTMKNTDQFHPFESDGELCGSLSRMPNYCNYRNPDSMWEYRKQKERILDALYNMFIETEERIQEYYDNRWNHAPGYHNPQNIVFPDWNNIANNCGAKIIKAAKTVKS